MARSANEMLAPGMRVLGLLLLLGCPGGAVRDAGKGDSGADNGAPDSGSGDSGTSDSAAGDSGAAGSGSGDSGDTGPCRPRTCAELDAECGAADDGCGATLTCGTCAAWTGCGIGGVPNQCAPAACQPYEEATTQGGGRGEDLDQAWTPRGINVGYYPFRVTAPLTQYSGDYTGTPDVTFTPGSGASGVILQVIPAGAYVGLSSTGPWFDPTGECSPDGTCGSESAVACSNSSPPLRPGVAGFYWGYAYQGASHMQGWIYADAAALEYAGADASHPCADGPAGADYEVASAYGAPTACNGGCPTCGDTNPCTEGADDCGAERCGAQSGGALTPSAHRPTVSYPSEAVARTTRTPPDPRVQCLPNGAEGDVFDVYPHGAYLYWAQNSTTKAWLHPGDRVQEYFHARDAQGVLWDFVDVLASGAPILTAPSDGAGAGSGCSSSTPEGCPPPRDGGTCGWVRDIFLQRACGGGW